VQVHPTLDVPRCMFRPFRSLPRTSLLQRLLPWLATSPPISNAVSFNWARTMETHLTRVGGTVGDRQLGSESADADGSRFQ
jgi:hypothetical protein